jgi:transglutaminase-like putative cysteine protease
LYSIVHTTELSYTSRISESVIELRVAPRSDELQTLRGFGLAVGPAASVFEHVDWLGNRVHHFSIVDFHDRLVIEAQSAVEVRERSLSLSAAADELSGLPDDHRLADFRAFGGPVDRCDELGALARRLELEHAGKVGVAAERVMRALRQEIAYKKGVTTSASPVSEVVRKGAGVCQDFTHVAIALLRALRVPTRYVSGYLHREGVSELETHAWLEAFIPSLGWVGLDPTHGDLAGTGHVAVAVGRSFADVPPNRGIFRGDASEAIKARVEMKSVAQVPRNLLAPRPVPLSVPTYDQGPTPHREKLDYQLEQVQQQQQQQQQ